MSLEHVHRLFKGRATYTKLTKLETNLSLNECVVIYRIVT